MTDAQVEIEQAALKVLLEKSKDLKHAVAIRKKYLAEKKSIALPVIKKLSNLK